MQKQPPKKINSSHNFDKGIAEHISYNSSCSKREEEHIVIAPRCPLGLNFPYFDLVPKLKVWLLQA